MVSKSPLDNGNRHGGFVPRVFQGGKPLGKGPGGPDNTDMELVERVERVEKDVGEIKGVLTRLESAVANLVAEVSRVKVDLAEIKGQLKAVPTIWQLAAVIFSINAGLIALTAFAFNVLRH